MASDGYKDYRWTYEGMGDVHARILPELLRYAGDLRPGMRVIDVGCGNGFICSEFARRNCTVVGTDLSSSGIETARRSYPAARFVLMPADRTSLADLQEEPFDLVVSTEVVEHLYAPGDYASGCFDLLKPGGRFICTTPYHGYLKNVAIALAGKWDSHVNPLWHGGHIKFWSRRTLAQLLRQAGFENVKFSGVGRLPWLWKTMVMCCDKPGLSRA